MRIAFNATPLLSPLTGIGQYTYFLAKAMHEMPALDFNLFYAFSWSRELRHNQLPGIVTFKSLIKRLLPNAYAASRAVQQRIFTEGARACKADIYHEPNFLAYQFEGPSVITVHDLSWIRYPETHPADRVRAMNRYFESGLRKASLVLTDSDFIKSEVVDLLGLKYEQVQSVPLGVDTSFYPRTETETRTVLDKYKLRHRQYLLLVGTLEPRKNLKLAFDAWSMLPAALRKRYSLVLVGMKGWHTAAFAKQMSSLMRAGELISLGYVDKGELPQIIAGATAFVYPSIYEGFGLPPLEAMACGVPVIASNMSSLPEVIGQGGLLIDPYQPEALAEAIKQVVLDPICSADLAKRAIIQSAKFTWDACVEKTIKAYQDVVAAV